MGKIKDEMEREQRFKEAEFGQRIEQLEAEAEAEKIDEDDDGGGDEINYKAENALFNSRQYD